MTPNQQDHGVPGLEARICSAMPSFTLSAVLTVTNCTTLTYSQVHNKRDGQIKWGRGLKDFKRFLNGERVKVNRGMGTKYERKETKIGLFLLRLPYSLHVVFSYQPLTPLKRVGYPQTYISMESL